MTLGSTRWRATATVSGHPASRIECLATVVEVVLAQLLGLPGWSGSRPGVPEPASDRRPAGRGTAAAEPVEMLDGQPHSEDPVHPGPYSAGDGLSKPCGIQSECRIVQLRRSGPDAALDTSNLDAQPSVRLSRWRWPRESATAGCRWPSSSVMGRSHLIRSEERVNGENGPGRGGSRGRSSPACRANGCLLDGGPSGRSPAAPRTSRMTSWRPWHRRASLVR